MNKQGPGWDPENLFVLATLILAFHRSLAVNKQWTCSRCIARNESRLKRQVWPHLDFSEILILILGSSLYIAQPLPSPQTVDLICSVIRSHWEIGIFVPKCAMESQATTTLTNQGKIFHTANSYLECIFLGFAMVIEQLHSKRDHGRTAICFHEGIGSQTVQAQSSA